MPLVPVDPASLSPAEQQEIASLEAAPQQTPLNPLRDLSSQELFELTTKDPDNFDIVREFRNNKELWQNPEVVQKAADALNAAKARGFSFADLPGPGKVAGMALDVAKGFGKQLWNYAAAATPAALTSEQGRTEAQRRIAENWAGTELAMQGLAGMAKRGVEKAKHGLFGVSKRFDEFTPEEKVKDLFNEVGRVDVDEEIAKGKGGFLTGVGGEVIKELEQKGQPVRPEEAQQLAAGDPFSWYLFGKAFEGAGKIAGKVAPGLAQKGAQVVEQAGAKASELAGNVLEKAGQEIQGAAKVAAVVPKVITPAVGGAAGGVAGALKIGPIGVLPGIAGGQVAAKSIGAGAKAVSKAAEKAGTAVEQLGKEISGSEAVTGAYAQLGRDVAQAIPGVAAGAGKGALMDIGLAATTAETPQETGSVGLGTVLGAAGGAAQGARNVISGQIIAPRSWGSTTLTPSSGQFQALESAHRQSFDSASPGVKLRVNAIRQFAKQVAPNADVFFVSDPAALKDALTQSGMSPEQADVFSQQLGFFTAELPSATGQPRRVIVARDVDAAPHESFHVIQDVLGEQANQKIDDIVKRSYADRWDVEGQRYAQRLGVDLNQSTWQEGILDRSGWGLDAAKEKLIQTVGLERAGAILQKVIADAQARNAEALPQEVWRDVLSTDEAQKAADTYISRELAAENFDAVFKRGLQPDNSLPGQLARIAARLMNALGVEPLAGRQTEIGQIQPKFEVAEAVRGAVPEGAAPTVKPAPSAQPVSPRKPISPVGETNPVNEAQNARQLALSAGKAPVEKGTRSPQELLNTVADAIEQNAGVRINYLSAPDAPAADIFSNRAVRRAVIEAFRTMPAASRSLWEKTFFPDRVIQTKNGYQVMGWSPEVFASNAHKLARAVSQLGPEVQRAMPYEIDPKTGTFTENGWKSLFEDTQKFVQNQVAGQTGAGAPVVVPAETAARGFRQPSAREGAVTESLPQDRADIINTLFGIKLPETPRITKGRYPRNLAAQEVSAATLPGRVEEPARPRVPFSGEEAQRQGIEGREIQEVNPFRNLLEQASEAAGKETPSFIEAIQRLNLENIKEVELTPEATPEFRAKEFTLAAGFQPQTEAGRKLAEEGFEFRVSPTDNPSMREITLFKDGERVALIESHRITPDQASIDMVTVEKGFRERGIGETLYRELATTLQKDGVKEVTGLAIHPAPIKIREKVFGPGEITEVQMGDSAPTWDIAHKISPTAKFQPVVEQVSKMSPDEFRKWAEEQHGFTLVAYDVGRKASSQEEVNALKENAEKFTKQAMDLMREQNDIPFEQKMNDVSSLASQGQFFNEAWQYATGEGSGGEQARKEGFQPKFSVAKGAKAGDNIEVKGQAQPVKLKESMIDKEIKPTERNSNNAWGFGGMIGKEWVFPNGFVFRKGTAYFRHLDPKPIAYGLNPDGQRIPESELLQAIEPWIKNEGAKVKGQAQPSKPILGMTNEDGETRGHSIPESGLRLNTNQHAPEYTHASLGMVGGLPWRFLPKDNTIFWWADSSEITPALRDFAEVWLSKKGVENPKHAFIYAEPYRGANTGINEDNYKKSHGGQTQFQPVKPEDYKLKGTGAISNMWVLPNGKPVAIGGQLHDSWLKENTDITGEGEQRTRTEALRQGYARIAYALNSGRLTVEARRKDWPKIRDTVIGVVQENNHKIDNATVSLFDDKVEKVLATESKQLFNYDTSEEKLANFPLLEANTQETRKEIGPPEAEGLRPEPPEASQAVRGKAQSVAETFARESGTQGAENFSSATFGAELEKVREGDITGQTFTRRGNIWRMGATDSDIVTLASTNIPRDEATPERIRQIMAPYTEALKDVNVSAGIFAFDQNGKPMVSVDLNAVVPQEFRQNSVKFAKDNNQIAIWDALKAEEVKTGGTGDTRLKSPDQIRAALQNLLEGRPVNIENILNPVKAQAQPEQSELLPDETTGSKRPLSSAEVARMTRKELEDYYPEAIVPEKPDQPIPSQILESPLFKQAGDEESAVKAFADKLVEFADSKKDDPSFKAGAEWYSDFVPKLKAAFGEDAPIMAELLAATSPQTNVETNFRYALEALDGLKSGQFAKVVSKFNEGMAKIADGSWKPWYDKEVKNGNVPKPPAKPTSATFLAHWIEKFDLKPVRTNGKLFGQHSVAVLKVFARRWLAENGGIKTRNFVANITGEGKEATIDLWADRTMRRVGYSGFEPRWRIMPKNIQGVPDKDFLFAQKAFRAAAERLGLEPSALQGALWFAEKNLWAENGWSRLDLGDFRNELAKIPLIREAARATVKEAKPEQQELVKPRKLKGK